MEAAAVRRLVRRLRFSQPTKLSAAGAPPGGPGPLRWCLLSLELQSSTGTEEVAFLVVHAVGRRWGPARRSGVPPLGASCPSSFSGLGTEEAVARPLGFDCLTSMLLTRVATVVHGACPVRCHGLLSCLGTGPVARGWIGPPLPEWRQASHRVFMTVVHISLYELIAPLRFESL